MNGIFQIDLVSIKRALVQGLLVGIITAITFILHAGSIFGLNFHSLIDSAVLAGLATLPPLLTSFLTTHEGAFLGTTKVE